MLRNFDQSFEIPKVRLLRGRQHNTLEGIGGLYPDVPRQGTGRSMVETSSGPAVNDVISI